MDAGTVSELAHDVMLAPDRCGSQAHVPSECQSVASQLCDAPSPLAEDNMSSPTLIIAGEARAAVGVLLM